MRTVTVEDIVQAGACYEREEIEALWAGREALSAREIAELDIRLTDIVWALDNLWPEARPKALEKIVTRAITNNLGQSGSPDWEAWAENWLSGPCRTAEAAEAAARAAEAAARASERQGWAAVAAARAARTAAEAEAARATREAAAAAGAAAVAAGAATVVAAVAGAAERRLQIADYLEEIEK